MKGRLGCILTLGVMVGLVGPVVLLPDGIVRYMPVVAMVPHLFSGQWLLFLVIILAHLGMYLVLTVLVFAFVSLLRGRAFAARSDPAASRGQEKERDP